ncbi:unnamed protein product, partial [Symbiodinium sp. CCMP2456]
SREQTGYVMTPDLNALHDCVPDPDVQALFNTIEPGQTVLDEARQGAHQGAMLEARILVEAVVEHSLLAEHRAPNTARRQECVQDISLASVVPITPYQQSVLDLGALMPFLRTPQTEAELDWLDNDLGIITGDVAVPLEYRTQFVNIKLLVGYAANTAVREDSPYYLGEPDDTPQTSEQLALAWALCWTIEFAPAFSCPVRFAYDCMVAGKGAFGEWKPPAARGECRQSELPLYLLHLRQIAVSRVQLDHMHVPGHAGHLENEFSDQISKQARRQETTAGDKLLPLWPSQLRTHDLCPWTWLLAANGPDVPALYAFESEAARLQTLDARPVSAPFPVQEQQASTAECAYSFAAITYNVLTLRDTHKGKGSEPAGLRIMGRKTIFKQQLEKLSPLFVGLQETRLPEACMQADSDYWIYQSAATTHGHLGCALWVARKVEYARKAGRNLYISDSDVNISGVSPRHLCACIHAEALRLMVMVVHAPSACKVPLDEVQAFWRDRAADLARRPAGFDFLILADANARVGHISTDHVGDHHSETENAAGEVLHDFLQETGAFLPTAFPDIHEGGSITWKSPTGDTARLDYPIVPLSWRNFALRSQVLDCLEMLQLRDDHYPVMLHCACVQQAPPTAYQAKRRAALRPAKPATPQERQHTRRCLAQVPLIPWHMDVDAHYEQLSEDWINAGIAMQDTSAPNVAAPMQPHVSEHARHLALMRQGLRQYLKMEAGERQTVQHLAAEAMQRLHLYGFYIRKQVELDRRAYLKSLADNVRMQDIRHPQALYYAVRKAYPAARSARKSAFKPLPAVRDDKGELVVTCADRNERWRRHFADQEAGHVVTEQQYIQHVQDKSRLRETAVFDIHAVPTLAELETIAQALRTGRAAGLDRVTSEFLQSHTPTTMRQLLPICLKSALALREPVHFRGGELICLAKKAGAALQCSGFRSILISSVPGKVLHRALRTRLVNLLMAHCPAMQAGAVPGEGIEHIALAAQSFQQLHQGHKRPWALVFYDIQAAFYSVIRELVVPSTASDEGLLRLLHALRLPDGAIAELREKLEGIALLPKLGASDHLTALVQDLYRGTWFKLTQSSVITLTQRGTRPGDPAADAVFGLVMSAMLRSITESLAQSDLLPVPLEPENPPHWARATDTGGWGCPAWADDFVQPVEGPNDTTLLQRVQRAAGIVAERVTALGMHLTYARDKTAVLLPSWISPTQQPIQLNADGEPFIRVENRLLVTHHSLPVVTAYKHLGGIVTADAKPGPDLRFRFARALAVVKPLRARLFADKGTPISIRRALLRSLAISKLSHTGAALYLKASIHQRLWAQQYISLWRNLFAKAGPTHHVHAYEVLLLAQAAPPPLALARARATFLARVVRAGPTPLGTLLYAHWQQSPSTAWLTQLEADYHTVAAFLPEVKGLISASSPVEGILEALDVDPRWWLRQTVAAARSFHRDLVKWRAAGSVTPQPEPVEVKEAEAEAKSHATRLKKGIWQEYLPPRAAIPAYGPPLPTKDERAVGRDEEDEEVFLSELRPTYSPSTAIRQWLEAYVGGASKEGPRMTA